MLVVQDDRKVFVRWVEAFECKILSMAVEVLAAARSRSGSDSHLGCHSLPSRRFATPVPTKLTFSPYGGVTPDAKIIIKHCGSKTYALHLI